MNGNRMPSPHIRRIPLVRNNHHIHTHQCFDRGFITKQTKLYSRSRWVSSTRLLRMLCIALSLLSCVRTTVSDSDRYNGDAPPVTKKIKPMLITLETTTTAPSSLANPPDAVIPGLHEWFNDAISTVYEREYTELNTLNDFLFVNSTLVTLEEYYGTSTASAVRKNDNDPYTPTYTSVTNLIYEGSATFYVPSYGSTPKPKELNELAQQALSELSLPTSHQFSSPSVSIVSITVSAWKPTQWPTATPTGQPSVSPTTESPSVSPTDSPTRNPTKVPTRRPTRSPTVTPTRLPTVTPGNPTRNPTASPTNAPSSVTLSPTLDDSTSFFGGGEGSESSTFPSAFPTASPALSLNVLNTSAQNASAKQKLKRVEYPMIVGLASGMSLVLIAGMLLYQRRSQKEAVSVANDGSTKRRIGLPGCQRKKRNDTSRAVAMEKALDTYWGHTYTHGRIFHSTSNDELHITATSTEGSDATPTTRNLRHADILQDWSVSEEETSHHIGASDHGNELYLNTDGASPWTHRTASPGVPTTKRLEDERTRSAALELYLATNHVSPANQHHYQHHIPQVGGITTPVPPQRRQPPHPPQSTSNSSRSLENLSHMVSNTLTQQRSAVNANANQCTQTPGDNRNPSGATSSASIPSRRLPLPFNPKRTIKMSKTAVDALFHTSPHLPNVRDTSRSTSNNSIPLPSNHPLPLASYFGNTHYTNDDARSIASSSTNPSYFQPDTNPWDFNDNTLDIETQSISTANTQRTNSARKLLPPTHTHTATHPQTHLPHPPPPRGFERQDSDSASDTSAGIITARDGLPFVNAEGHPSPW